jgi:hypothetical protein
MEQVDGHDDLFPPGEINEQTIDAGEPILEETKADLSDGSRVETMLFTARLKTCPDEKEVLAQGL